MGPGLKGMRSPPEPQHPPAPDGYGPDIVAIDLTTGAEAWRYSFNSGPGRHLVDLGDSVGVVMELGDHRSSE